MYFISAALLNIGVVFKLGICKRTRVGSLANKITIGYLYKEDKNKGQSE